jgi:hypothetical protein
MHQHPYYTRRASRRRFAACLAVVAAVLFLGLGPVPNAAGQEEPPQILPVNPVPNIELVRFDFYGYLDELREDVAIVDDSAFSFSLTEEVKFYVEGASTPVDPSVFKVGDLVGVVYDDFNKLRELWKLKKMPLQED